MWQEIEEIKNFALSIFNQAVDKDFFDEWHQFNELADVHIKISDEPDQYGICELQIYVYPLVKDQLLGRFTTDTSKGIEIL